MCGPAPGRPKASRADAARTDGVHVREAAPRTPRSNRTLGDCSTTVDRLGFRCISKADDLCHTRCTEPAVCTEGRCTAWVVHCVRGPADETVWRSGGSGGNPEC